jgi:hypothetical protein
MEDGFVEVEGDAAHSGPAGSSPTLRKDSYSYSPDTGINTGGLQFLKMHPFVKSTLEDKVYGCVVGSALGDTIGLYSEFLSKVACESAYPDRRFSLTEPVTRPYQDQHRRKFFSPPESEILSGAGSA